ncbi:hypothetical protein [Pseudocitrobacter corydidari]
MFLNNSCLKLITLSLVYLLSGCDYAEKIKLIDGLQQQQEKQNERIQSLEKQQKVNLEQIEKQQLLIINSTKTLTKVVSDIKNQQDTFLFTEFNPAQTKYFILNNGSVGLAGRILSIDAAENGSQIHISLVNLLSVPVSNIGFHATWGGAKPSDAKAYAQWQQLLFSTSMNSTLRLLPGQWQDIILTLKGISPNNLKYLKLAINMENIQFDTLQPAETRQRKSKK